MASFFADSYAIIEILKGNGHYLPYQQARYLATTEFNLCEVAFAICRDYPDKAKDIMEHVREMITLVPTTDEDYCSGAVTKRSTASQGKKLSTIDCVGYSVACRLDIPFLTGDREFRDIPGVEFVH